MGMHRTAATTPGRMVAQLAVVLRLAVRIPAIAMPSAAPPAYAPDRGSNRRRKNCRRLHYHSATTTHSMHSLPTAWIQVRY